MLLNYQGRSLNPPAPLLQATVLFELWEITVYATRGPITKNPGSVLTTFNRIQVLRLASTYEISQAMSVALKTGPSVQTRWYSK